jgi:hypothetical protein
LLTFSHPEFCSFSGIPVLRVLFNNSGIYSSANYLTQDAALLLLVKKIGHVHRKTTQREVEQEAMFNEYMMQEG